MSAKSKIGLTLLDRLSLTKVPPPTVDQYGAVITIRKCDSHTADIAQLIDS